VGFGVFKRYYFAVSFQDYKMKITADKFIKLWSEFSKSYDLKNKYQSTSKAWTDSVLGKATCQTEQSPFGSFIKAKTGEKFVCRNEDGDVDMSLSDYGVFEILPIQKKFAQVPQLLNGYPTNYNVIIENENDISRCHQEMIKLTYYKSILKVLITYNFDEHQENQWKGIENKITANFSSILRQTNSQLPENKDTQYLFIIGQMIFHLPALQWTFVVYDIFGQETGRKIEVEVI